MKMTELWETKDSGILYQEPLLLKANQKGIFGQSVFYPGGSIHQALFTYVCGTPDQAFFNTHKERFFGQWLVCMSPAWERFLRAQPMEKVLRRRMMKPRCGVSFKMTAPLPEGYLLSPFTAEIFGQHPFEHGRNYADFREFKRLGSGFVILFKGKVVAAASSFLTLQQEVELDVSTDPAHRRRGLADHCVKEMMADCTARDLRIHWDAQNEASFQLALSHGFQEAQAYAVYILKT